jgi:hypothetical protein
VGHACASSPQAHDINIVAVVYERYSTRGGKLSDYAKDMIPEWCPISQDVRLVMVQFEVLTKVVKHIPKLNVERRDFGNMGDTVRADITFEHWTVCMSRSRLLHELLG